MARERAGRRAIAASSRSSTRESHRVLKLWTQTVVAPILSSLLFILVFGLSLGSRIKQIDGVDYEVFIVPGLIAMAMIQATYANNSASVFQARFDRYLNDVLAAPMRPWEVNLALSIGGVVRALLIGAGLLACVDGGRRRAGAPPARARRSPSRWRSCCSRPFGVIVGVYANSWDHTAFVTNIVILPLTFLGGVFYSVDRLPSPWHEISHVNPIFYLLNAVRYGFLGTQRRQRRALAGGDRRARGGHGRVELMAVSDRAPAQALRARAASRSSSSPSRRCSSAPRWRARSSTRSGPRAPRCCARCSPPRSCWLVWRPSLRGHAPRDLRLVGALRARPGGDEPLHLRVVRAHPAGHRGDDRVRRAARGRRRALAPAPGPRGGRRSPRSGSCCSPTPAAARSTRVGVALALVAAACWAAYILIAQAGVATCSPAGAAWRIAMAVAVLVPLVPGWPARAADLLAPQLAGHRLRGRAAELGAALLAGDRGAAAAAGARVRRAHEPRAGGRGDRRLGRARPGPGRARRRRRSRW